MVGAGAMEYMSCLCTEAACPGCGWKPELGQGCLRPSAGLG